MCHHKLHNAVDFTLSFDTSFAPTEALLDVRTSTFTAKTVLFKFLFTYFCIQHGLVFLVQSFDNKHLNV